MIGKVSGRIDYKADDHVLIEAAGVGYVVHCAPGTIAALPGPGEAAALYTEMVVREDLMQLYGFRTLAEREWHRLLTSVQGVGARVSLALIDALGLAGLGRALAAGDAVALRRAPGVGPKLATRIASELKGKAPAMMALGAGPRTAPVPEPVAGQGAAPRPAPAPAAEDKALAASADALSALVNLGYDRSEAAAAVAEAGADGGADEATLIRAALQSLGRNL
ncbi:MAG TPA: Holliday junction branch migration protein RuvA [Paracoccaceae bacterium]|nr:Holliday junction branch migration protein RuvA [Paracoccaceae bacterium]